MEMDGESIMRTLWMMAAQVLLLPGALLAAEAEFDPNAEAAKHFKVQWSSVRYDRSVVVENPAISTTSPSSSETVTLSCQAEIRDPNLVLGVSREGGITQITDSKGRSVAVSAPAARSRQMYEGLHYTQRFRQPPPAPRWQTIVGYIMRRPSPAPGPPQLVMELEPCRITMLLDKELLRPNERKLESVEGYFHALVAKSVENIDVPFEPNDRWVRLTPDVEVQVREAVSSADSYRFWIETRPEGGAGMHPPTVGGPLPGRMVVARQFLGEDGKPSQHGSPPFLPAPIGGRGSGGGANCRIKTIRFAVALAPTERKIPFKLSDVPLPDRQQKNADE